MLQRQNKPLAKHASETLGVGADERQEAAQSGQCALDHEKPANNKADPVCCDSVPTPNAVLKSLWDMTEADFTEAHG